MRYFFSITLLCIVLLHSLSYAQDMEMSKTSSASDTASQPQSSTDWANQALDLYKNQTFPEALVAIEKSLALNPYQNKAFQLRSKIYDQLPYTSHRISIWTYIATALPKFLFLILGVFFFVWFMKSSGVWFNGHRNYILVADKIKMHTVVAGSLALLTLLLYFFHIQWASQTWVCLTEEQNSLHSAPSEEANILRTFTAGACFVPMKKQKGWVSVHAGDSSGWMPSKRLKPVRGAL